MSLPLLLVVDDEPQVTEMLAMVLELNPRIEAITTNSSVRAREILEQGKVALLLTDYLMPAVNGIDLIRTLRQQGSNIPVIIITGYRDEPELAAAAETLGPCEIIGKPWNTEHLLRRIDHWLGAQSRA